MIKQTEKNIKNAKCRIFTGGRIKKGCKSNKISSRKWKVDVKIKTMSIKNFLLFI